MITPLDSLRAMLASAFNASLAHTDGWTDSAATARMLKEIRNRHDGPGLPPDTKTLAAAVERFSRTGVPDGWRGLKYVCFGAGLLDEEGWCVLSDSKLRDRLLSLAQEQELPRKRLRCYQALLSCYLGFSLAKANKYARKGWLVLRAWLAAQLLPAECDAGHRPRWLATLLAHQNLLQDNPCGKYGPKLLVGDGSELQEVVAGLGIPSDSWVHEEAVIAQMRAGIALDHDRFREALPGMLNLVTGKADVRLATSLQTRCVAMLVSRYVKIPGKPEHMELRDAAVNFIGNPWLRRSAWDAAVVDDSGQPDDEAREMVYGWLKRRLISDFFELLSQDGVGDRRRLDYWLGFEPFMDDMWFALGRNTSRRRDGGFCEFRTRARGRLLELHGTTAPDNNAFIMSMGEYVAIEFGQIGNAFFLYRWGHLPPELARKLKSCSEPVDVTIHALKSSGYQRKMSHVAQWEQRFDENICPLLGLRRTGKAIWKPDLEALIREYDTKVEDLREHGGALWLLKDDRDTVFSTKARVLGFGYRHGRGWWKE